jgi:hypothetical protein
MSEEIYGPCMKCGHYRPLVRVAKAGRGIEEAELWCEDCVLPKRLFGLEA